MEVASTRSYTQMAIQHTGCSMHIYNPMAVQCAAVQCAAILKWLFNAQLFNAQLGWVRSSILKYQVDNRCNFTDRMEKVGQIEIGKLMTKMT